VLRRVAALEEAMGVQLFDRLPGGYVLTPAGEEMHRVALEVEESLAAAGRRLSGLDAQVCGTLRVTTVDAGDPAGFFLLVLGIVALMYAGLAYLMDAPFGRTLIAIRANEKRVPFLGVNPLVHRMLAYVLAANVAALAGALYPMLRGFVSPELLFFQTSGNAVITVIVGGVGTLIGPVLGSVLLADSW